MVWLRSWDSTRLFVFICCSILLLSIPLEGQITAIIPGKFFSVGTAGSGSIIELKRDDSGNLLALMESIPIRIIKIKADGSESGEFDIESSGFDIASDMFISGVHEIILTSPWSGELKRFSLKRGILPSLIPETGGREFRPISAVLTRDSKLFVINDADSDVWTVNSDGRAFPAHWSRNSGGVLDNPQHIDYSLQANKLIILDGDVLRIFEPFSQPGTGIKTSMEAPTNLGVLGNEVWVSGEGLSCFSIKESSLLFSIPADSLKSWNIYPLTDVLPLNEDRLAVVSRTGSKGLFLKIIRKVQGNPE